MVVRRKDNKGRVLKEGESQRKDGTYDFRYRTSDGKRHSIYAKTLEELREKEAMIQRDKSDGIRTDAKNTTINDIYDLWCQLKKGIKENTFQNYKYMYDTFVYHDFGKKKISTIKKSDVRRFYNTLVDQRNMQVRTLETIHTVLYQVFELAVEEMYLRNNPSSNAMKELKQARNFEVEKRRALTVKEQDLFVKALKEDESLARWRPIFLTMLFTGMRVGEASGLRWQDVNFDTNEISINHTLVYYKHEENGSYFSINTPKSKAGFRTIPMLPIVREALLEEKKYQESSGVPQDITIDGYTGFIFINRYGNVQNQGLLNKALRYIMRVTNEKVIENAKDGEDVVLIPRISCHNLRHTFATRLCEAEINVKVIQETLGHKDIKTTFNIYADATKDLKEREFKKLNNYLKE